MLANLKAINYKFKILKFVKILTNSLNQKISKFPALNPLVKKKFFNPLNFSIYQILNKFFSYMI